MKIYIRVKKQTNIQIIQKLQTKIDKHLSVNGDEEKYALTLKEIDINYY